MSTLRCLGLVAALLVSGIVSVHAAVSPVLSYQGKLMQPDGTPVPDGRYSILFAIYDVPTGSEPLWSETNPSVQVKGGLFAVMLGSVVNLPANIFDSSDRFFTIKVADDPEMTPRQQVASVAFSVKADIATTVYDGAITTAKIAPASITADKLAPGVAVPPGTILMWSGAVNDIPKGWTVCDGQNGTPDLRNRFVVGAGDEYAVAATGGEAFHKLSANEMPSHTHFMLTFSEFFYANGSSFGRMLWGTGYSNNTGGSGGDQPHENRPPYYALCFIMKSGY